MSSWLRAEQHQPKGAPAVIPVLLSLVALRPLNGNQHGTKHLRRDQLHSWGALLLECITEVLACKPPSTVRQEQMYLIRTLWFPSTPRLPLTRPEFNRSRRRSLSISQQPQKIQFQKWTKVQGGYFPVSHPKLVCLDQNKLG